MDLKKAVTRLSAFASKEHPWIRIVPGNSARGPLAYTTDGSVGMLVHIDPHALVPEDVTVQAEAALGALKLAKHAELCFRNVPPGPSGRLVRLDMGEDGGDVFLPAATPHEAGGIPQWGKKPARVLADRTAFARCAKFASAVVAAPGFDFVKADPTGFLACDGTRLCHYADEGLAPFPVLLPKKLGKSWPKATKETPDAFFSFDDNTGVASFVNGDEVRFGMAVDARIFPDLKPVFELEPIGVHVSDVPVALLKQACKFAIVASGVSGLIELVFTETNISASGILSDDARRSQHDVPIVGPPGLNVRQVFSGRLLWNTLNEVDGETCDLVVGSGTQALGILDGQFTQQVVPQWRA